MAINPNLFLFSISPTIAAVSYIEASPAMPLTQNFA
jgi:hypothetical protein